MSTSYVVGDSLTVLRSLPDASVDFVMSSPPFLALRAYLPADHPDKAHEIGSESTPGEFLDTLLDIVVECRRVLTPTGSLCFELGDTYSGNERGGQAFVDYKTGVAKKPDIPMGKRDRSNGWPLDKSKTLIPELFAVALSYGFNSLTGRTIEPWRVRNVVAWCRPNPPVGALGDKYRPATSYLTVACTARDRWFDLDAVRTKHKTGDHHFRYPDTNYVHQDTGAGRGDDGKAWYSTLNPNGAPPLDYWVIPTAPYKGAHYATYPPELCRIPILSMCPREVCRVCGEPRRRITETTQEDTGRTTNGSKPRDRSESFAGTTYEKRTLAAVETLGWTDCGHDDYRRGIVLDPFAGSGTTLMVAEGLGRDSIGIDLDARNLDLACERCGMFLTEGVPA